MSVSVCLSVCVSVSVCVSHVYLCLSVCVRPPCDSSLRLLPATPLCVCVFFLGEGGGEDGRDLLWPIPTLARA